MQKLSATNTPNIVELHDLYLFNSDGVKYIVLVMELCDANISELIL